MAQSEAVQLPGRRPASWLSIIGPGAIVASLTIGSGELVFSSRGGALFGYPLLSFFLMICLLKWGLVLLTARQMVLSGAHPFERWCELPGPRGWLVWVFLVLAILSFPIWVSFHAGTIGTLVASLTGTESALDSASHYAWGMLVLGLTMVLVQTGGYQRLERIQLGIVVTMLVCVGISLILLQPDWTEMLSGLFSPWKISYPNWIARYPKWNARPLWVELVGYVGVLGGSGYDYLAYVSFLREKHWGAAGGSVLDTHELQRVANDDQHPYRGWLRAPLIDASISFLVVFVFSAVFVACGATVLRPAEQIPDGTDLLTLQAKFMEVGSTWMRPLYFVGALLAMLGTLYGTIEVAPTIAGEMARALGKTDLSKIQIHRWVTTWVSFGGSVVLGASIALAQASKQGTPPALIKILDPANLFTGVLACGIISGLACWSDRKFLPRKLRANWLLLLLNGLACPLFLLLGIKAYWDHSGSWAFLMLLLTLASGWLMADWWNRRLADKRFTVR